MRIIFMGTPEFAIPSLEALLKTNYHITAVVTAPDKPAGRGKKLTSPPVKKFAKKHGLRVFQPEKLRENSFVAELKTLNPDLMIVVAFRMLPKVVWSIPTHGSFNLHASLLPQYRGAAPINWAIINDESETGLTTFFIDEKIDTGNIILQENIHIKETDTAGDLHDRLAKEGGRLVVQTTDLIHKGREMLIPQNDIISDPHLLKPAPKIEKEDTRIDWQQSARKIYNLIRGLSPYPTAFSKITDDENTITVKIYLAGYREEDHKHAPGTILSDENKYLHVATSNGYIEIQKLQQAGKKAMDTPDFLRGFQDLRKYRFI